VFDTAAWKGQLGSAIGVISCLGAFGSNDFMQKVLLDSHPARQAACMTFLSCLEYLGPFRAHIALRRLQHHSLQ
jgi:hypothetical protein